MRSGLAAHKFIANNKRIAGTMIIAFAVSVMAMYVVYCLLIITNMSMRPVMLQLPKKVIYIGLDDDVIGIDREDYGDADEYSEAVRAKRDEIVAAASAHEGVDGAFYTQILNARYNAAVGGLGFEGPLLSVEEIPEYLEHMDAELIRGRMPEGDGEILVSDVLMKNQSLHIGDWFEEDSYGQVFKVVGVIDHSLPIFTGTPQGYTNNGWYMVVLCDETACDAAKLMADLGYELGPNDDYYDAPQYREAFRTEVEDVINGSIDVTMLVVMSFLALSVLIAYVSLLRNRVNEYCLYASIGYSRSAVYGMMMREMFLLIGIGSFIGVALSLIGAAMVKKMMIIPLGLAGNIVYPVQLGRIGAILVLIAGILQIPMIVTCSKVKTIDAIED